MTWNKCIVVGAGGTGSYLIPPLARFLAARKFAGQLIICDADKYDAKNAERQEFPSTKQGLNKAEVQAMSVCARIPDFKDNVSYLEKYLGEADVNELVVENTIVVSCVDNAALRNYVENRVGKLDRAAHVCPGNEEFNGQVQLSLRYNGEWKTRNIFEDSPAFATANDDRSKLTCEQLAALPGGGQVIMANFMAAALSLNYIGQLFELSPINKNGHIPCDSVNFNITSQGFTRRGLKTLALVL